MPDDIPQSQPRTAPPDPLASVKPFPSVEALASHHETRKLPTKGRPAALLPWQVRMEAETPRPSGAADPSPTAYLLRRQLAQGGFGEVWEGVQQSLGRVVAVKRIRQDYLDRFADDPETLDALAQNFRAEATTTGCLEHPNIVPVYDLGLDARGMPQLAMKLIRGRPWDDLIRKDWSKLPFEEFLARHLPILIGAAQAVAFAHAHGIVHRDIKPSQVMVGEFGETLLVDWGLAVTVDPQALKSRTHASFDAIAPTIAEASNPSGTAAFMAPEQTRDTAEGIGRWTDIFLLGGTLYYLLTGQTPHRMDDPERTIHFAALCEIVPPAERQKKREVPRELAALAMRAMARDPKARVPTAQAFIEGLQDYLSGASRRRESDAIVHQVDRRLWRAERGEYDTEQTQTTHSGLHAAESRGPDQVYRVLAECLAMLANARSLWRDNPDVRGQRERALKLYAKVALDRGDLGLARAQADRMLDAGEQASVLGEIARREARTLAHARQRRLAFVAVGIIGAAVVLSAMVSTVQQRALNAAIMRERDRAQELAADLQKERDLAYRARSDAQDLLVFMLNDVRQKLVPVGRLDVLEDVGAKALDYFSALPAGQLSDRTEFGRAFALRQRADVARQAGDSAAAEADAAASLAIMARLCAKEPVRTDYLDDLAWCHYLLGDIRRARGDAEGAMAAYRECEAIRRKLIAAEPDSAEWRRGLLTALLRIGDALRRRGELAPAEAALREAIALSQGVSFDSADPESLRDLSVAWNAVGDLVRQQGDPARALESYRSAHAIRQALADRDPRSMTAKRDLLVSHDRLGVALRRMKDFAGARQHFDEALRLAEWLVAADPKSALWQRDFAAALDNLGRLDMQQGRFDQARDLFARRLAAVESLRASDPSNADWHIDLIRTRLASGTLELQAGRDADSAIQFAAAVDEARAFAAARPANADGADFLAEALASLGAAHLAARAPSEAAPHLREAIVLREKEPAELLPASIVISLGQLADCEHRLGNRAEAAAQLARARQKLSPALDAAEPPAFGKALAAWLLVLEARMARDAGAPHTDSATSALELVDAALAASGDPQFHSVRAQALLMLGRAAEAQADVQAVRDAHLRDPDLDDELAR